MNIYSTMGASDRARTETRALRMVASGSGSAGLGDLFGAEASDWSRSILLFPDSVLSSEEDPDCS